MLLEKIAKKLTLRDGYAASQSLRRLFEGFVVFYTIQAVAVGVFVGLGLVVENPDLRLISGALLALPLGLMTGITVVLLSIYGGAVILLALAARKDIAWLSAAVSWISLTAHLIIAILLAALLVVLVEGVLSSNESLVLSQIAIPNLGADLVLWTIGTILFIDTLIWLSLIVVAVSRSMGSLVSSFAKVPGRYEYAYGTHVFSASGLESEMEFLSEMLSRSRSHSSTEAEDILETEDRYLIRFASRDGGLVAVSLQELPDYNLVALLPGEHNRSTNAAVLLEDSLHIQSLRVRDARGALRKDDLIADVAREQGWTVDVRDMLMNLRRP